MNKLIQSTPLVDATLTVTAGKEVILSAGSFGTPHILLNSGIGKKAHLDSVGVKTVHNLPDVGRGMSTYGYPYVIREESDILEVNSTNETSQHGSQSVCFV